MDRILFGNTLTDHLLTFMVMIVGLFIAGLVSRKVALNLKHHHGFLMIDAATTEMIASRLLRFLQVTSLWVIGFFLDFPPKMYDAFRIVLWGLTLIYGVRFLSIACRLVLESAIHKRGAASRATGYLGSIMLLVNALLWSLASIFFLSNLGYNVTAILTGLGIGGIAIALAAQHILVDLFNYFVIFFDRPFDVGEFIIVDDKKGTIEHIGIKTTRIRSPEGEVLILSNTDLTKSRIHNYKRMIKRRVAFWIKVPLHTSLEQLKIVPQFVNTCILELEGAVFDRANLITITDSYNFEVVYILDNPDYNHYAQMQERINLKLIDEFRRLKIQFAVPVRVMEFRKGEASKAHEPFDKLPSIFGA